MIATVVTPPPDPCNEPAAVVSQARPVMPAGLASYGTGDVVLLVTLNPNSKPVRTQILTSSGVASVDRAVQKAALASDYATQVEGCKPLQAQLRFSVTIAAPTPAPAQAAGAPGVPAADVPAVNVACKGEYHEAALVSEAPVVYPDSARALHLGTLSVVVEVSVRGNGSVYAADLYQSSDIAAIDQEALRVAHASKYSGAMRDCVASDGEVMVTVPFHP